MRNLDDSRLRAVLEDAATKFGWGKSSPAQGHGFGIAGGAEKGGYIATCAEIAVDRATGSVKVVRAVSAFECGAIVNPDHLRNQVEGGLIMGLGAALFEAIRFENGKILNPRFSRYPGPGSATSLRSTLSCAIARTCPRPAVERPPSSPSPRPPPTPSIAPRETGCGRCRWCRKEWSRVNQVFQFCA